MHLFPLCMCPPEPGVSAFASLCPLSSPSGPSPVFSLGRDEPDAASWAHYAPDQPHPRCVAGLLAGKWGDPSQLGEPCSCAHQPGPVTGTQPGRLSQQGRLRAGRGGAGGARSAGCDAPSVTLCSSCSSLRLEKGMEVLADVAHLLEVPASVFVDIE